MPIDPSLLIPLFPDYNPKPTGPNPDNKARRRRRRKKPQHQHPLERMELGDNPQHKKLGRTNENEGAREHESPP
jgi:hypothetical protein